jgi:hypothetical protein
MVSQKGCRRKLPQPIFRTKSAHTKALRNLSRQPFSEPLFEVDRPKCEGDNRSVAELRSVPIS